MKRSSSTPRWWNRAYQEGLIDQASPVTIEEPSVLVIAMALLGALVCVLPLVGFLVLLFDEALLSEMTGQILGGAIFGLSLGLLRQASDGRGRALRHSIGLVLWGLGSGLLLMNVVTHMPSLWDGWVWVYSLAFCLSGIPACMASARWIQMVMGWSGGIFLYLTVNGLAHLHSWWIFWAVMAYGMFAAWWVWLWFEQRRLAQPLRCLSQARWAILADAGVLGALCASVFLVESDVWLGLSSEHWGIGPSELFVTLSRWSALAVVLLSTGGLLQVWGRRGVLDQGSLPLICLSAAVLGAGAWFYPSLASGVLVATAALAFARWRIAIVTAVLAVLYLVDFYYNLDWTLVAKSIGLLALGVLLWASVLLLQKRTAVTTDARSAADNLTKGVAAVRGGWLAITVGALLALGVVNWDIYRKTQVIEHGQRILVPLVPVDPRSLLQGDYMDLRFDLPDSITEALNDSQASTRYVTARVDEQGITTLLQLTDLPATLSANEVVLPLKRLKGRWVLVTDAYFFPEGQGARFEDAKYGDFRVMSDGRALLVGLATAGGEAIEPSP